MRGSDEVMYKEDENKRNESALSVSIREGQDEGARQWYRKIGSFSTGIRSSEGRWLLGDVRSLLPRLYPKIDLDLTLV